jgi:hypothetical protein
MIILIQSCRVKESNMENCGLPLGKSKTSRAKLAFLVSLLLPWCASADQNPSAAADFTENTGHRLTFNVLANDREFDGEELKIVSATKEGTCASEIAVAIDGPRIVVTTSDFVPRNCVINYSIEDSRMNSANSSLTLTATTLGIFADGFETGNTSKWSATQ